MKHADIVIWCARNGFIAVYLAVAGDVFDGVFLCCPFFPLDVLGGI